MSAYESNIRWISAGDTPAGSAASASGASARPRCAATGLTIARTRMPDHARRLNMIMRRTSSSLPQQPAQLAQLVIAHRGNRVLGAAARRQPRCAHGIEILIVDKARNDNERRVVVGHD